MRKELSHHTMSARSRTAAGPRERGWSRMVPEVLCERPLPNKPVHSRTRTRSFSLSHGLCSVFPMIFDLFRARMLERFQVCDRLSIVSPHFWGDLAISRKTQFLWLVSHSALTRKTHKFGGLSLVHYESTSTRSWCSSAARLHGSFVTVKTQASSRPSGHSARVIFRVPSLLVFPCSFASGTARARSFCTHQRPRITESAVLKHIHHKDRRQLQLSRRRWLHDCTASYVRYRSRHLLVAVTLCEALASVSVASSKKARKAEHVPFASRERQVHEVSML